MASTSGQQRLVFFPKADAAILSLKPPPDYPQTVGPIYDSKNANTPVLPWSLDAQLANYPPPEESYAPATIPDQPVRPADRYLRASLTKNERFRLSMVWYYTRDIFKETEFLSGLQEKVCIAHEAVGWDFAIIGILDINNYIRLATVNLPLGILPRGECICAHTAAQPPGSVFLLPNMLEDWRFAQSPYVESGGLRAYAGAPLRLQNEPGQTACLGTICVASATAEQSPTRPQQAALARLADWVVSDLVHLTRARRRRVRSRMVDLIAQAQSETEDADSEEHVVRVLREIYPDAVIKLQPSNAGYIQAEGRGPVPLSEIANGLWEDVDHIDQFIEDSNHLEPPTDRVVRIIAAKCESVSGESWLTIGTKDFRLVFDDIDAWFVQSCARIVSDVWLKHLLTEVMHAKEKFLRGFCHQLRTPVHGILGSAELLAEELKARSSADTASKAIALLTATAAVNDEIGGEPSIYLETIKRAGRDLISIINSMITLNRWADIATTARQYATQTLYDLETELWNATEKAISNDPRYPASVTFTHQLPPDQCRIMTDLGLLRDSLLPLVVNALQNTPAGSVAIEISAQSDKKELIVDVKDTGKGILPEDQERIFELYERVDSYSSGAGIGLTLASKFAALLQGSVKLVSSEIGRGSHFRATFQGMDMTYSPHPEWEISKLTNLPKHFHTISSGSKSSPMGDHFTRFLTCHGLTPSANMQESIIIVDSIIEEEQNHTVLSELSSEQAVICVTPYSEHDGRRKTVFQNVIYVHGPFLTSKMRQALEKADSHLADVRSARAGSMQSQIDLPKDVKEHGPPRQDMMPQHDTETGIDEPVMESRTTREAPPPYEEHKMEELPVSLGNQNTENNTIDGRLDLETNVLPVGLPLRMGRSPVRPTGISHSYLESSGNISTEPISDAAPLAEVPSSRTIPVFPPPTESSHPTALLVDDNPVNLRIMQMYCDKRSLPYVCARDGLEAVSFFQSHQTSAAADKTKAPIQLIFMDLQMPNCDGIEASKRIRQMEAEQGWGESTLFVVTGQDSREDRKAVVDVGGQEYYVKPVSMKTLDRGLVKYFPLFKA